MTESQEQYIGKVKHATALAMNIDQDTLSAKTRKVEAVMARFIGWMIIRREHPTLGYKHIGQCYGGRNHATIIHGIREGEMCVFGNEKLPPLTEWREAYMRVQRNMTDIQ